MTFTSGPVLLQELDEEHEVVRHELEEAQSAATAAEEELTDTQVHPALWLHTLGMYAYHCIYSECNVPYSGYFSRGDNLHDVRGGGSSAKYRGAKYILLITL